MSVILLVKVDGMARLYQTNTRETDEAGKPVVRFKAWKDRNGIDLYWMGRRVDQLYTMGVSTKVWYQISIPYAADYLLEEGACVEVSSEPSPEGRLPK